MNIRVISLFRHWHRRLGAIAAIFFLFLALSGIALNHTGALRLDQRQIGTPWLIAWYGIRQNPPTQGYPLPGNRFLATDGENWSLDGRLLHGDDENVIGALALDEIYYIATPDRLYLYRDDGQLVDKLSGKSLPPMPIERIGMADHTVVLQTQSGLFSSADALRWRPIKSGHVVWSQPEPLTGQAQTAAKRALAPHLPLQRVLLDLHSGRIFGRYGPLMVDLLGLILATLGGTGLYLWFRTHGQRRHSMGKVKYD